MLLPSMSIVAESYVQTEAVVACIHEVLSNTTRYCSSGYVLLARIREDIQRKMVLHIFERGAKSAEAKDYFPF
jgi:hypothetical protein